MNGTMTSERRFDPLGLESPFAAGGGGGSPAYEETPWSNEGEGAASILWAPQTLLRRIGGVAAAAGAALGAAASADDPPKLATMLGIPGRFDDPKRNSALEMDGTRFAEFLKGRGRREFASHWLNSRPALALAAGEPQAELAAGDIAKAWFVIHDVGAGGSTTDQRFKAADPAVKKNAVHGFLNRAGYFAATHDFDKNRMGTVFEFLSKKGLKICGAKTINIETVPDIEKFKLKANGSRPPPSNAERYASIGYAKLLPGAIAKDKLKRTHAYYKWTHEAFDVLADLYILASARAGHLLTVTVHKEMDRNLARSLIWNEVDAKTLRTSKNKFMISARDKPSNYHGDPYAFDMQSFYNCVTAKLNALGGRQMPPGARYGVHPERVRRKDGRDIGNGDSQKHEFPHQSNPVVRTEGNMKKDGWWNAQTTNESANEAAWSQSEWQEGLAAESDFASEWNLAEEEAEQLSPCGAHEDGEQASDALHEEEQLAWLDLETESGSDCPHCGTRKIGFGAAEAWLETEQYSQGEGDLEDTPDFESFDHFGEAASAYDEADFLFETDAESLDFEAEAQAPATSSFALLRAIPDRKDASVPLDYRLNAKAIVGKLGFDLQNLKAPGANDLTKFAQKAWKFVSGGSPVSVMVNLLGSALKNIPGGYLAAAESIAEDWSARGFSRGVVLGADGRTQTYMLEMFGREFIPPNRIFPYGRKIAIANYGAGLLAGYVQGRSLSKNQFAVFWRDLVARMGDQSYRGKTATWNPKQWQDWYVEAAAAFRQHHL